MKTVYIFVFVLLAALGTSAQAQPTARYASQRLEQMAERLAGLDDKTAPLPIYQTFNKQGEIDHIGFRIFAEQLKQENPSPVYRFVERYLLELYLTENEEERNRMLKEDKVEIDGELIARLSECRNVSIALEENRYAVSILDGDKQLLWMRFPAQYELLWGMGKKEVEARFYTDMISEGGRASLPDQIGGEANHGRAGMPDLLSNGMYAATGDYYIIEAMNDTRFYWKQEDGNFRLVCDPTYPEESVRNLWLEPEAIGAEVEVEVTQRLYGGKRLSFTVPLTRLLDFCKAQGCKTYVGIEQIKRHKVEGTVILQNESCGYCHLIYFETSTDIPPAKIEATLFAYVPTHNVAELYPK